MDLIANVGCPFRPAGSNEPCFSRAERKTVPQQILRNIVPICAYMVVEYRQSGARLKRNSFKAFRISNRDPSRHPG